MLDIAGSEIGDKTPLVNGIWADGSARSRAARQDGDRGRRLGAAGVPAGAVHDGPERRDGDRALQAHRRRLRPAADRVPVSAGDRPGLSERDHPADDRGHPDPEGDQGLGRHAAAARVARPHAAEPVAAVQRAVDAELVADGVAELGCKGLLSGCGSVIADLQAQLFRAVQAGDLKTAQALNDRIYPLAQRVLRAALGRHAQPHEGGAGADGQAAARRGAAAAGQDRARRDRAHPQGAGRGEAAEGGGAKAA